MAPLVRLPCHTANSGRHTVLCGRGQTVLNTLLPSKVPIPLLNGGIFVCPTVGIKAGLTVIFGKVRTRCTIIRAVSLISFVRTCLSLFRNPPGNGSSAPPLGNSLRDPAFPGVYFLNVFLPYRVGVENACRGCAQNVQDFADSQNADT